MVELLAKWLNEEVGLSKVSHKTDQISHFVDFSEVGIRNTRISIGRTSLIADSCA
jgi:hypothetical protein